MHMKKIIVWFVTFTLGFLTGGGVLYIFYATHLRVVESSAQTEVVTQEKNLKKEVTPIVTFVDDDGETSFIDQYVPILQKYHIKGCGSIIMGTQGMSGYATKEQLLDLQKKGWDMLNHSCDIDQLTDANYKEKVDYALTLAKQDDFIAAKKIFVYPNGFFDLTIKSYTALYFNYGLNADGNVNQIDSFQKMNTSRYFLDPSMSQKKTLDEIKDMLKENTWLIISTHSGEKDGLKNLESVLSYITKENVKIMTVTKAIQEIEKM